MKVTEHIEKAQKPLFTFEVLPPLKGKNIESIYETIEALLEFSPAYMNITYHREEIEFQKQENGLLKKRSVKKRPGTVAISAAVHHKYQSLDVVPHLICGGFNRQETEDALIDLNFLGIRNILALRGDPEKSSKNFIAKEDGHSYAIELVKQIADMNRGHYLDSEVVNQSPTDFCIGVAGYPEKHVEAPNMDTDLRNLKAKVDAGAEYIVTQLFFDNQKYFDFVDKCRKFGIDVPIIPGLKPLSTKKQLNILPQTFFIDIPDELVREINKCKTDEAVKQVGVEWAIKQSKELYSSKVPGIHYYTMGKAEETKKIVKAVF
jgi:methylenetetrahydrofolate reductase (NADPH)